MSKYVHHSIVYHNKIIRNKLPNSRRFLNDETSLRWNAWQLLKNMLIFLYIYKNSCDSMINIYQFNWKRETCSMTRQTYVLRHDKHMCQEGHIPQCLSGGLYVRTSLQMTSVSCAYLCPFVFYIKLLLNFVVKKQNSLKPRWFSLCNVSLLCPFPPSPKTLPSLRPPVSHLDHRLSFLMGVPAPAEGSSLSLLCSEASGTLLAQHSVPLFLWTPFPSKFSLPPAPTPRGTCNTSPVHPLSSPWSPHLLRVYPSFKAHLL